METFLKTLKYLRITLISLSVIVLIGFSIVLAFYSTEEGIEEAMLTPVEDVVSQNEATSAQLDQLGKFVNPIDLNTQEFSKTNIFE